jgi:hypothetical protein
VCAYAYTRVRLSLPACAHRSQRQRELVYAADFQLQLMERKVARASGVRTPQEQKELKAKIAELTESLENYTTQFGMLTTQCKRARLPSVDIHARPATVPVWFSRARAFPMPVLRAEQRPQAGKAAGRR